MGKNKRYFFELRRNWAMAENYKNDIINAMKKAFEESGYYEAYQVYNTVRLPYPTDNTKKIVEEAE